MADENATWKGERDETQRPIWVHVDGQRVCKDRRIGVNGKASMTLLPDAYVVDLYNLTDQEMAIIKNGKYVNVTYPPEGLICYGEIEDMYTHKKEANTVTSLVVVDGRTFSETLVSRSVGGGASVYTAMSSIVGTGVLGAFLATDTRLIRGQTFSGKLPDVVSTLARAVNARAFYTHGSLFVTEKGRAESFLTLDDKDVVDEPAFADGTCIVRTVMKSFAVGTIITYRGTQYRMAAWTCIADNFEGPWRLELTLVDESSVDTYGMEGG